MNKLWRVGNKERKYVNEVLDNGLTGEFNQRLEDEFARKFESQYAISVNSGTSALHSALYAMGVREGDEVIVPPLTFASTAFSALYLGAKPVYVDIDPETFNIDPNKIEEAITDKTKAIIPVSLYGLPADLESIVSIAKDNNLKVLEDNAQCYLGKINGKLAGTFGDASIFSFERSKHATSGHGGIIITSDEEIADNSRKFSILGYSTMKAGVYAAKPSKDQIQNPDFDRHVMVAPNYRLPELCAAVALAQTERLDRLVKERKNIAKSYRNAVKKCEWLHPQKNPKGFENSYFTYAMALDTNEVDWQDFRRVFLEEGGEPFYAAWKLTYQEPVFEGQYPEGLCPIAEDLQKKLIQLKTNFGNRRKTTEQRLALQKTIERIDNGKY